ncbi:hypothetical protein [Aeromicrobium sp.]|uniref:hypothetical protein n=1 Tax=Aeromicrobium sp. TaxID=1871063 RepID=UPI002FCBED1B
MTSSVHLKDFVNEISAAARAVNHEAFFAAGQRLADAVHQASRQDLDDAAALLVPVLADAPLSLGGPLAQYLSSLIGMDGDVAPVLDVLVEGACEALEGTRLFVSLYEELVGPVPERAACGSTEFEQFVESAAERTDDPGAVARRWMYAEPWVQPVLFLSQRVDVRRALPQRERLQAAALAAEEDLPELAPWLVGLLRIRDGDPLIVLHRSTGTGFRVTVSGVADNFQLHTMLAAHIIPLLPVPRKGLIRRRNAPEVPLGPTPAMVAAADGSGPVEPEGGVTGQFNLVDGYGKWIWNEARPDEIPLFGGSRVIVLDPLPYERGWNAGRAYPLLRAIAEVATLSPDEARSWLSRVHAAHPAHVATSSTNALVWTDDLTVSLPSNRDVAEVVTFTLELSERGIAGLELQQAVAAEFSLSSDDSAVAVDRVFGGITRAATGNVANRPDPTRDPIAFESYLRSVERPET